MSDIKIIFSSSNTDDNIIYELMKIEADVYEPEYRGEYESIQKRFHKNKEMFVFAMDSDRIVGYLCFFPISDELYREMLYGGRFYDDDISPDDIVEYSEKSHIYLLSIALYKSYQGAGIGASMMEAFLKRIKHEDNYMIDDIIASVVTAKGEKIVVKFGFEVVKDYWENAGYKLYRKKGG